MHPFPRYRSLAASLLFLFAHCTAAAEGGFLGFGGNEHTPSLTLKPAEIALDAPTSIQGNDLALLLAQAGKGNSLTAMKEKASRKFSAELQRILYTQLQEFFDDEEVPLVQEGGFLTLRNYLDISIGKQLNNLKQDGNTEVEQGTIELSGDFHYRLDNPAGTPLREQHIDIGDLRVREKYRVKRGRDGNVDDTTDAAINRALTNLVKRLIDRVEDNLEADALRELAAG